MTDPYAQIAAFYDAEFSDAHADVDGYLRRGVPGPVLVLGCGTGRVCRPLALTRPVTGLDRSAPMLARARRAGGAVTWVEGDLTDFDLGSFAEVILPNGAFNFLPTRAAQDRCLRAVRRALPAGAPVTLDLPMPDFALLGQAHTPPTVAWEGRVDGHAARRTREVFRSPVLGRLDLVDRFEIDGRPVAVTTLPLRLIFPSEIEWILEAGGFWVDAVWGDHRESPLREGCDRLLVRAIAA